MKIDKIISSVSKEGLVLEKLQHSIMPISEQELLNSIKLKYNIDVSRYLDTTLKNLIKAGYDIRTLYSNRRRALFLSRTGEQKPYFKKMGTLILPALITSDWHMGSYSFSEIAYNRLIDDLKEYKVKSIVHLGDLLQGLGIYKTELRDLAITDIDSQVDFAVNHMERIPKNIDIHLCLGGHEEVLKGKHQVGFDALRLVASSLPN